MTISDRNKHLRIVAEILLVHLPGLLDDQELARDLLSVAGVTLRAAWEDAEKSCHQVPGFLSRRRGGESRPPTTREEPHAQAGAGVTLRAWAGLRLCPLAFSIACSNPGSF
jgi:hypothetical protein